MECMSAPSSNPSGIRIGNDERAAAMKALDEHMSAGRLDAEEYGERVAQASVARTRTEIDVLFTDLPQPHPFPAPPPDRPRPAAAADRFVQRVSSGRPVMRLVMLVLVGLVVLAALPFLLAGAILVFVVLPMLTCGGVRGRYRRYGWYQRGWRS